MTRHIRVRASPVSCVNCAGFGWKAARRLAAMRFLKWTFNACLFSVVATGAIVGCSSDDDEPGGAGGAAGEAGAATAGAGGDSGAGGAGDAGAAGSGSEDPGALIEVTATGRVGVMLDEIPTEMRERVVASLLA